MANFLIRPLIATVVLLSLVTPVFWMLVGQQSREHAHNEAYVEVKETFDANRNEEAGGGLEAPSQIAAADFTGRDGIGGKLSTEDQVQQKDSTADSQGEVARLPVAAEVTGRGALLFGGDSGLPNEERVKPERKEEQEPQALQEEHKRPEERHIQSVEVPDDPKAFKVDYLSKALRVQLEHANKLYEDSRERENKQLLKHMAIAIDKGQGIIDRLDKEGLWSGDELAIGAVKLLETINARAREWKSSYYVIKKLKFDLLKVKAKVVKVTRERNVFDLAAAKALPKSLHCLGMRLTMEHSNNPDVKEEQRRQVKEQQLAFEDPSLNHYAIFSDNVLAASVVVNSTVMNAKDSHRHVFHLVTDEMNKGAMEAWFALHPPGEAALEIQAVEDFTWLNASYAPVLAQLNSEHMKSYYFGIFSSDNSSSTPGDAKAEDIAGARQPKYRNPKYLSMLNHLRFYLPEVYPKLDKIVFLDDDVVVQKDLEPLFRLPLEGNVNAAVFTCKGEVHRLHRYLNFSNPFIRDNYNPQGCGWAYGMNVFDLTAWREKKLTEVYHNFQTRNADRSLWLLGTLPPGLMVFYNLTLSLDPQWHVLNLGFNENTPLPNIEQAAVIHWNGNQKPWTDMAIKQFKPFWTKYVASDNEVVQQCNINVH
eukprot:jgi/Mesen1/10554/ME000083S10058